ncbi:hypothetical protein GCM10027286_27550 [Virgibacillus ainsalahensis]
MIDKHSPIPIYYQLEEQIKNFIQSENLAPGDILPSEREMSEKYKINRMTVRQAINNLVAQGLVYRQKGRGTFIAEEKFEQDLSGLSSFSEDMLNHIKSWCQKHKGEFKHFCNTGKEGCKRCGHQ